MPGSASTSSEAVPQLRKEEPNQQTVLLCITGHGRRQMLQVPTLATDSALIQPCSAAFPKRQTCR
eukprot:12930761-Prorocentrum_lima.AAC.1